MTRRTSLLARRGSALAAIAVSAALVLAGCSGGGGSSSDDGPSLEGHTAGAMENFTADEQFTATEPVDFSMLWTDWPDTPITDTWQIFDEIKKRTNVSLDLTNIPFSDATEKRSLLISAGDAPYVIPLTYTGDETQFAASGAVLPMSDYVDQMPNFQKYVKEWHLEDMMDNLRQADGKYYMLPGLQEVSVPVFTLILRKDVFDEVGAKIPETWDELRDGLAKIKAKYPDSHPLADGFEGQSMINYAAHAFGTVAGWGLGNATFWNKDEKKFEFAGNDGYKQMVEYFRGLYDDGLLDGDSFTASNDGSGTVTEKFAAGKVFAASGSAGTVQDFSTALDQTVGKGNYELVQIAPPGGPAGQVVEPRNFWNGFMLTTDAAKDPHFLAMLQFLDWLYYNPDAREMLRWGVEGQTYTKDANGKITLKPEFSYDAFGINPDGKTDILKDLGFGNNVLADATESRALKESYNSHQLVDYIDAVSSTRTPRAPFPAAPLNESELEQSALMATPIKDTLNTNTLKFILGQRPLSEWSTFLGEVEGQNLSGYLGLINGAQKRFAEKNG